MLFTFLGLTVVLVPAVLLAVLGGTTLAGRPLSERSTGRCTQASVVVGLAAAVAILLLMLVTGHRRIVVEVGNWVVIPQADFHFHIQFVFDRLSVPFAILSLVLVGVVGAFADCYMHREPGYRRFFLLYAVFLLGMVTAAVAGTIETLFFGWELVGLSSALLVAYFHERPAPVLNGQHVWGVYRVSDAMFLVAAVALHHMTGEGDFLRLMGDGIWPGGEAALTPGQALFVGGLLVVAAAAKSALVPFSSWLPRAMEGPTPSSAVFYGALSVHLGTFLLLRAGPILDRSIWLSSAVVVLGAVSAVYGAMTARVQSDVKSALAFASLAQVGLITAEIGLGFRYLALVHIIGHAVLRTLQLLRAPNLLHDYHALENAIGGHLPRQMTIEQRLVPPRFQGPIYALLLDRGRFDALLGEFIVRPFVSVFRWCDGLERRWIAFLSAGPGPAVPPPAPRPSSAGHEELP